MPYITIATNTTIEDESAFLKRLSIKVAEILGKPERFVMTELRTASLMTFGGSIEACAYATLTSLGMTAEQHPAIAQELFELLALELGAPPDRIYLNFDAPERHSFAWNRKTFAQ